MIVGIVVPALILATALAFGARLVQLGTGFARASQGAPPDTVPGSLQPLVNALGPTAEVNDMNRSHATNVQAASLTASISTPTGTGNPCPAVYAAAVKLGYQSRSGYTSSSCAQKQDAVDTLTAPDGSEVAVSWAAGVALQLSVEGPQPK